jgi:glycerol-3-phosphate dehydrogenase
MQRDLKKLANETFDVAIVGGGVFGLSAAWACSLRGMRVALIEQGDFGAATSSGTLKLAQGGLQDLSALNLRGLRFLAGERRHLLRMAPHLVQPMPVVVPCYSESRYRPKILCAALRLSDLATGSRNHGIGDPSRHIPRIRFINRANSMAYVPEFLSRRLKGAVLYTEAQVYSPERLCLAFAASAAHHGAVLANYCRAAGFERRGNAVEAVTAEDILSGARFALRAKAFFNMAGPWAAGLVEGLDGAPPRARARWGKGIQLVTASMNQDFAFGIPAAPPCPEGWFRQGHGGYLAIPWRQHTVIGTSWSAHVGSPDSFRVTETDIGRFLDDFNETFRGAPIQRSDIRFWTGGLYPMKSSSDDQTVAIARQTSFTDHARHGGPENLVTVVGAKHAVFRAVAEQAADAAALKLGRVFAPAGTAHQGLWGGGVDRFDAAVRDTAHRHRLGSAVAARLVRMYGDQLDNIMKLAREKAELGLFVADSQEILRAELVHAAREECAMTLTDVVLRRTDLGTQGHPGRAALEHCASILAGELAWSPSRRLSEIEKTEAVYRIEDA